MQSHLYGGSNDIIRSQKSQSAKATEQISQTLNGRLLKNVPIEEQQVEQSNLKPGNKTKMNMVHTQPMMTNSFNFRLIYTETP